MSALRRHTLVWLATAPRADHEPDRELVGEWHARGRPFVVCRQRGADDDLSLGFCAPTSGTGGQRPRRVAACASAARVTHATPPPALADVALAAPAPHAGGLARLARDAAEAGLSPRVFGSWMWQTLTSEPHVRDGSDLDLLVEVSSAAEADAAAALLERVSPALPFRLDGELSIRGVGEVMWREYRWGGDELMLKSVDAVRLLPREALWA